MPTTPYNVALKVWDNFSGDLKSDSIHQLQAELEINKKLLHFFQAGDFYYYVFNVNTAEFEFVSPSITNVLGYQVSEITLQFLFNKIHPEDQVHYVNFENEVGRFLHSLPKEKMFQYKVRMNFRIQNSSGNYIQILYQATALEQDEHGKIVRSLGSHTDITHLKPSIKPTLSFISLDGSDSYVDVQIGKPLIPVKEPLSLREKEILKLIINGKQNKEIAEILFISKQTVDKHRKNMIKRNNVNNSGELIAEAIKNGWI
jgi:DNA-binding CsgD family transcriptional regulator